MCKPHLLKLRVGLSYEQISGFCKFEQWTSGNAVWSVIQTVQTIIKPLDPLVKLFEQLVKMFDW